MLDDSNTAQPSPFARLMRQVDAALLDRRPLATGAQTGDPTA